MKDIVILNCETPKKLYNHFKTKREIMENTKNDERKIRSLDYSSMVCTTQKAIDEFFVLYCDCFGNRHVEYQGKQKWCIECKKPIFK